MMRLVSTNSMAISVACHAPEEDVADGYLLPVPWGLVAVQGGVGECVFTTASDVKWPEIGRMYR